MPYNYMQKTNRRVLQPRAEAMSYHSEQMSCIPNLHRTDACAQLRDLRHRYKEWVKEKKNHSVKISN